MRVRVFSDSAKLADSAATEIAAWLRLNGEAPTLGLAGGSTSRVVYERLREEHLQWSRVHLWMTDERFVHPDDPASNQRMARETLADHVAATFHDVPIFENDPHGSAAAYEEQLRRHLLGSSGSLQPGLLLLGIGDDGHTASLFPGTAALEAVTPGFVANEVPDNGWRLTATLPLLTAARRTMFIVTGETKAKVVAEILAGGSDHPAGAVSDRSRDAVWLLDRDAASRLDLYYS
ncbi:6-phosphogluconolactonase [bacterium]|nr:6-phosphogluconolactonase [bacterium]